MIVEVVSRAHETIVGRYFEEGGIGFVVADNPVSALMNANFIGILAWAIGIGIAIRHAGDTTRTVLNDLSNGITLIVRVIIRFAPVGIFGLVASTLASSGFGALLGYLHLLVVLIGCMLFVALVPVQAATDVLALLPDVEVGLIEQAQMCKQGLSGVIHTAMTLHGTAGA